MNKSSKIYGKSTRLAGHILGSEDPKKIKTWILLAIMALIVQKVKEAFRNSHSSFDKTLTNLRFLGTYKALLDQ